jgi:hypothetical protein
MPHHSLPKVQHWKHYQVEDSKLQRTPTKSANTDPEGFDSKAMQKVVDVFWPALLKITKKKKHL